MRIAAALRHAIGLAPAADPKQVDDQTYSEAVMENALRESDRTVERLAMVREEGTRSNTRLGAAIERMQISNTDKTDVMAELVRGMKSRQGMI